MANEPKKICLGPKALFFLSSHGTHLETYSYYENVPMVPNATILLQLLTYATIFSNIGEWSNATILQLYCNLCNYMQLYATYATICKCNMQLYETICNYIATICNYIATLCNYMQLMQLYYATIWNLCNL
jgi:hypothetical protein